MTKQVAHRRADNAKPPRHTVSLEKDGWPTTGLLRPDQIYGVGRLPISKSQFWVLVRERELTPVHLSPRVTCFWVQELREKLLGIKTTPDFEPAELSDQQIP